MNTKSGICPQNLSSTMKMPGLLLGSLSDVQLRKALVKTHAALADPYTSFNPVATLFKYLCEGELPAGETVLTAFKLSADALKPHLVPEMVFSHKIFAPKNPCNAPKTSFFPLSPEVLHHYRVLGEFSR